MHISFRFDELCGTFMTHDIGEHIEMSDMCRMVIDSSSFRSFRCVLKCKWKSFSNGLLNILPFLSIINWHQFIVIDVPCSQFSVPRTRLPRMNKENPIIIKHQHHFPVCHVLQSFYSILASPIRVWFCSFSHFEYSNRMETTQEFHYINNDFEAMKMVCFYILCIQSTHTHTNWIIIRFVRWPNGHAPI